MLKQIILARITLSNYFHEDHIHSTFTNELKGKNVLIYPDPDEPGQYFFVNPPNGPFYSYVFDREVRELTFVDIWRLKRNG